jgi:putative FmdB family regulatory protein
MPVYEYECSSCGTFSVLRKMSESQLPANCDVCGEISPRIMSVPRLAMMDNAKRSAYERNEKSAHEPRTARRSSCGCTGTHTCKSSNTTDKASANSKEKGSLLKMQTKKTARPWMLGH